MPSVRDLQAIARERQVSMETLSSIEIMIPGELHELVSNASQILPPNTHLLEVIHGECIKRRSSDSDPSNDRIYCQLINRTEGFLETA